MKKAKQSVSNEYQEDVEQRAYCVNAPYYIENEKLVILATVHKMEVFRGPMFSDVFLEWAMDNKIPENVLEHTCAAFYKKAEKQAMLEWFATTLTEVED